MSGCCGLTVINDTGMHKTMYQYSMIDYKKRFAFLFNVFRGIVRVMVILTGMAKKVKNL